METVEEEDVDDVLLTQLCHTYGHYADKCPDFERIIRQRSKSFSNTANLAQAFQANCNLDSTGTPPPSDWYVDSGASAHMTPSTSNLDSFVPYSGSENVQIGNGKCLPISCIGTSSLSSGLAL
ncbi:hypothetical protein Tco_0553279 [Tanacetum coccineum]